jgi:hypothetical protein
MSTAPAISERDTARVSAIRNYEYCCLAALLVLALALLQRGYAISALFPVVVGVVGVYARLGLAPVVLLLTLSFQLIEQYATGWALPHQFDVADLIQCAAVLGYVGAHYRLLGMTRSLLPVDPREPPRSSSGTAPVAHALGSPVRGSRRSVPPREIVLLIAAVAVWPLLAQAAWFCLDREWHEELQLRDSGWRLIILAWAVGVAMLLASGWLSYWSREHTGKDEAALYLQDTLWQEFRGEQRRGQRWLAWARLRYQRRIR